MKGYKPALQEFYSLNFSCLWKSLNHTDVREEMHESEQEGKDFLQINKHWDKVHFWSRSIKFL